MERITTLGDDYGNVGVGALKILSVLSKRVL